jgi:hypothetical protein
MLKPLKFKPNLITSLNICWMAIKSIFDIPNLIISAAILSTPTALFDFNESICLALVNQSISQYPFL